MMSSASHWEEYRKSGLITGFMITDALLYKHDESARNRCPKKLVPALEKVVKTWDLCSAAATVLSYKYLTTFRDFEEAMGVSVGPKMTAKTLKTCARTLVTVVDEDTGAWITLQGDDPPTEMWLESFAGSEQEIMKILITAVFPPSEEWKPRDLRVI